jgi:hypothetical protein
MRLVAARLHKDACGVAIVELAIALPVLLPLLAAPVEMGRLLSQYDTLTKSVRNAARYLAANALQGTTGVVSITPQVQSATKNLLVGGNVNGTGASPAGLGACFATHALCAGKYRGSGVSVPQWQLRMLLCHIRHGLCVPAAVWPRPQDTGAGRDRSWSPSGSPPASGD